MFWLGFAAANWGTGWFQDGDQSLFTSLACFEERTWSTSRTAVDVSNAALAALRAGGPFEPRVRQDG